MPDRIAAAGALREPPLQPEHALDALLAAATQVCACAAAARVRPSAAAPVSSLALADGVFGGAMARLLALLDEQGERGAQADIAATMAELVEVESRLVFSRQAFNDAVLAFNAAVRQFPTRLLSRAFGLRVAGPL